MKPRQGITPVVALLLLLVLVTLLVALIYFTYPFSGPTNVAESAYSYRFQPNASVTIPYSTYWQATPAESSPYWIFKEHPSVNTTCLHRTLPDKFAIDRYSKNGELQWIEIVNRYNVPVELEKYRVRDCLSKHGTVRIEGDT